MNEHLAQLYRTLIESYVYHRTRLVNEVITQKQFDDECKQLLRDHKEFYEKVIYADYKS